MRFNGYRVGFPNFGKYDYIALIMCSIYIVILFLPFRNLDNLTVHVEVQEERIGVSYLVIGRPPWDTVR